VLLDLVWISTFQGGACCLFDIFLFSLPFVFIFFFICKFSEYFFVWKNMQHETNPDVTTVLLNFDRQRFLATSNISPGVQWFHSISVYAPHPASAKYLPTEIKFVEWHSKLTMMWPELNVLRIANTNHVEQVCATGSSLRQIGTYFCKRIENKDSIQCWLHAPHFCWHAPWKYATSQMVYWIQVCVFSNQTLLAWHCPETKLHTHHVAFAVFVFVTRVCFKSWSDACLAENKINLLKTTEGHCMVLFLLI